MRKQILHVLLVLLFGQGCLICPVLAWVPTQIGMPAKEQALMVGAAEAVINPPSGSFLAGYGNNRKSTGVHDDLYAKAVLISGQNKTVVILALDCIGLPFPVVQEIRESVGQRIPVGAFDVGNIIVSSTHTHSGPDVIGLWGSDVMQSGIEDSYTAFLVTKVSDVILRAWENRQPAEARYAVAPAGEGWVENISVHDELDPNLTVLQFRDPKGKNIATLTNFACHPTILDGNNTLVSADFPSGFYKQMQFRLQGVNLYLQGAIGGWVQPENLPRSFGAAEKKGKELADIVVRALTNSRSLEGHTVHVVSKQLKFPVSNKQFQALAHAGVLKRTFNEGALTELMWFSVGNAVFATHPGETSPLYSIQTKALMDTSGPKFVLGLGQDLLGYILKPEFFQSGTSLHGAPYLISRSPDENAGALMMQVLEALQKEHTLNPGSVGQK